MVVYFICLKCNEDAALTDFGNDVVVKWVTTCPDCDPDSFT